MSCCKNTSPINGEKEIVSLWSRISFFSIGFIIITISLPFIWLVLLYFLFNNSLLNKDTNITPIMVYLWDNIVNKKNNITEDDDDDGEDVLGYNEEDYELLDYEEIK